MIIALVTAGITLAALALGIFSEEKRYRHRKTMLLSEILKILLVSICLCCVTHARPCGENPLRYVDRFFRGRGFDQSSALVFLRDNNPDYQNILSDYQKYLECTSMNNVGYFKRSVKRIAERLFKRLVKRSVENSASAGYKLLDADGSNSLEESQLELLSCRQQIENLLRNKFYTKTNVPVDQLTPLSIERYFKRKDSMGD